jgi:hypothetical protein
MREVSHLSGEGDAMTRWTNTRILGACGLTAAVLGFVGANVGMAWPRLGFAVTAIANGVMLGANLVLVFRRDGQ